MWAAAALASESGRSMHAASQVTSKAPPPWSARGFRHLAAKVALEHSFSLRSYPALPMIDYTLDTGAGDCEDCAILKYVALREAMVVGCRSPESREQHFRLEKDFLALAASEKCL